MTRMLRRYTAPAVLALAAALGACGDGEQDDDSDLSRYLLTTEFLGAQQGLSAARETDEAIALSFRTGAESELGREWLLTPLDDGAYRITNRAIGSGLSLDVVNDGVFDRVDLAPSDDVSGQQWFITPLDNGYCRLTTAFLGSEIALDVTSDTEAPRPTLRSVDNVSGQNWQLTQLGTDDGELDTRCTGVPGG